jgi:hypothetical protein
MNTRQLILFISTAALVTASLGARAGDVDRTYVEDFTTTQFKDSFNTTADWDTVAAELRLFSLPRIIGSSDTPGNALNVTVSGDYAFVTDYAFGLQVIDVSDPTNPTLVGTYDTPGTALAVVVEGDLAIVADGDHGLQLIDITNPTAPTLTGTFTGPDLARAVAVDGNIAVVANGTSELFLVDISDPSTPVLAGTYNTPSNPFAVAVDGNLAVVADYGAGLQLIDISDPTTPTLAGAYVTAGLAFGVAVAGDLAFVADWGAGLQVIDISDPTTPTLAGSYDTPGNAYSVVISGDRAYVGDDTAGLQVIDITDPTNPTSVGDCATPGRARGVTVAGGEAYVAADTSGLQVIDISDPAIPTLLGNYDTSGWARGIIVSGNYAFVADEPSGLQVIDISDPAIPTLAGTYDTPGSAIEVAVLGDYAFVADYASGLQVVDISDPTNPTLAGIYDTPGHAFGVTVSGDYAYVTDGIFGLQVIDVTDPATPALAASWDTPGDARDLAVWGYYAFVADIYGLYVIDISEPTNPTLAGSYATPSAASGIAVSGVHAFLASGGFGLQVIDISDRTSPTLAGSYDTPGTAVGVAVSGDHAFVADGSSGLVMIDISDPTDPSLAGTYYTPGYAHDITVSGDLAFVAAGPSGLQVIRVFQSDVDIDDNIGRSLSVNATDDTIAAARLTTTQSDLVSWELSANGGVDWQDMTPNGNWNQLTVPGTDLQWRSTHTLVVPGVNPGVTHLQIEWLFQAALIDSIVDVPGDQGGWIRAHFTRSGRDFPDQATVPIANYGLWRRVDSAALAAALEAQASSPNESNAADDMPVLGGMPVITYQGNLYVQSGPNRAASSFPPGVWEWVATVPAVQQDRYIAVVPTAADSSASGTHHTVLLITAHTTTPSIWYVSAPDSGYSLDNIAPSMPSGFAIAYNTGSGNQLVWDACPDEDFQHFNVYRSTDPDFVPSPSELVYSGIGTSWTDPEYDGWNVHYKVTALDYVGNESDAAGPESATAVSDAPPPAAFALGQNIPNPFNPTTTIHYDVPSGGGVVTLQVFDVSGRLVRTLVDGHQAPGSKSVVWNGTNERGQGVASGIYFCRMTAPGFSSTRKMLLVQ